MYIDTHVHFMYPDYVKAPDGIEGVIARAKAAGVTRFVSPGLDAKTSKKSIALAERFPEIIPAIGLHPLSPDEDLSQYADLIQHPLVRAVGEVGTDRNGEEMILQEKRLRFFIELGLTHKKPVLIHIRETWSDTFRVLADYPELRGKAVIHCFTGTFAEAHKMADLGLLMSVTAILARNNTAPEALEAVKQWPLDQLMLETDGPYLPWPGEKYPNEPRTVAKIAQFLADLKGLTLEEVAKTTTQVAEQFFQI